MPWWKKSANNDAQNEPQNRLQSALAAELHQEQAEKSQKQRQYEQRHNAEREAERIEAMTLLKSQLAYCFGINASPSANPAQVDNLWFGMGKYDTNGYGFRYDPHSETQSGPRYKWAISFHLPCKTCGHLRLGFVSFITDWDATKRSYQKNYEGMPSTFRPASWEENYAPRHIKDRGNLTAKQYWQKDLKEYQSVKMRQLAHYLQDIKAGSNNYYGPCPYCKVG